MVWLGPPDLSWLGSSVLCLLYLVHGGSRLFLKLKEDVPMYAFTQPSKIYVDLMSVRGAFGLT